MTLQKLGLALSSKGVIVAKLPYAARHLVNELKTIGITYNTAETTRDLGIDFSFSRKPNIRKKTYLSRESRTPKAHSTEYTE